MRLWKMIQFLGVWRVVRFLFTEGMENISSMSWLLAQRHIPQLPKLGSLSRDREKHMIDYLEILTFLVL